MGYQCPQRNILHIGIKEEEKEDNTTNWDDDVSLEDDDLVCNDYHVDASLMIVLRRILAILKVEEEDQHCTSISESLVICGPKAKKLIING